MENSILKALYDIDIEEQEKDFVKPMNYEKKKPIKRYKDKASIESDLTGFLAGKEKICKEVGIKLLIETKHKLCRIFLLQEYRMDKNKADEWLMETENVFLKEVRIFVIVNHEKLRFDKENLEGYERVMALGNNPRNAMKENIIKSRRTGKTELQNPNFRFPNPDDVFDN